MILKHETERHGVSRNHAPRFQMAHGPLAPLAGPGPPPREVTAKRTRRVEIWKPKATIGPRDDPVEASAAPTKRGVAFNCFQHLAATRLISGQARILGGTRRTAAAASAGARAQAQTGTRACKCMHVGFA